jgi:phosphoglycolate phosphatase
MTIDCALVFDLDGTLIDSIPDVHVAVNRTLDAFDRETVTLAQLNEIVGEGAKVMMEKAFAVGGAPVDDATIDEALSRYLGFYKQSPADKTIIYPGVWDVLDHYRDTGWPMGVCTNKPGEMTGIVLETIGMAKYFRAVTAGDNVPHRKPDGRHIHLTLERMGATDAKAVMVGDSATDLLAARDAGVSSVAVTYGYAHAGDDLKMADALIDRFEELPEAVDRLLGTSA